MNVHELFSQLLGHQTKALLLVATISRRPNPAHKLYKMSIQSHPAQRNN